MHVVNSVQDILLTLSARVCKFTDAATSGTDKVVTQLSHAAIYQKCQLYFFLPMPSSYINS